RPTPVAPPTAHVPPVARHSRPVTRPPVSPPPSPPPPPPSHSPEPQLVAGRRRQPLDARVARPERIRHRAAGCFPQPRAQRLARASELLRRRRVGQPGEAHVRRAVGGEIEPSRTPRFDGRPVEV